jgi:hypothetical protein
MHILPEKLRSDAPPVFPTGRTGRRTILYACASVLGFQPNCTIVSGPVVFRSLLTKVGK